jgi:hypothetical protein
MAKQKDPDVLLELPVSYGNVAVGENVIRLGAAVSRSNMKIAQADRHLCEQRLKVKLIACPKGSTADQGVLPGMPSGDTEIKTVVDILSYGVNGKRISFGMKMMRGMVRLTDIADFAKRDGRILVYEIEKIPEEEVAGEENGEE